VSDPSTVSIERRLPVFSYSGVSDPFTAAFQLTPSPSQPRLPCAADVSRRAARSAEGGLLYRDGAPVALLSGGEVSFLMELPAVLADLA
jgi:hypothetical protein